MILVFRSSRPPAQPSGDGCSNGRLRRWVGAASEGGGSIPRFPREPPGAEGQSEGGHQGDLVYTQLNRTEPFEHKNISHFNKRPWRWGSTYLSDCNKKFPKEESLFAETKFAWPVKVQWRLWWRRPRSRWRWRRSRSSPWHSSRGSRWKARQRWYKLHSSTKIRTSKGPLVTLVLPWLLKYLR